MITDGLDDISPTSVSPEITQTVLEGGGLRLSLRDPVEITSNPIAHDKVREAARIITMAWGDRYISDLISLTIPALIAPGNIPALAQQFDCQLVIVTETRLFPLIIYAPVTLELLKYCDVRLLPIDDLLSSWYGVTLTYALVRGFADLGPAMVDTHLIFLNADFILADGSYQKLAEVISNGARLVVSPSYCVALEEVVPELRRRYDPSFHSLSVSSREMASLILAHRHLCIRAKTVNQTLFNIGLFDQFYWYVDDHTMIGRQLPIALVYMRPERVLTELSTFWDYGVIAEYCPSAKPYVLGDSDDFLMAELRSESTYHDRIKLGWPHVNAIARHLSSYITSDHRTYGQYDLVLHSQALPRDIDLEKAKLDEFVRSVYRRLAAPIAHENHPFWTMAWPYFSAARSEQAPKMKIRERIAAELHNSPQFLEQTRAFELWRLQLRDIERRFASLQKNRQRCEQEATDRIEREYQSQLDHLRQNCARVRRELSVTLLPVESDFQGPALEANPVWQTKQTADELRIQMWRELLVTPLIKQLEELNLELGMNALDEKDDLPVETLLGDARTPHSPAIASTRPVSLIEKIYVAMFGRIPQTTSWHPYYSVLQHVNASIKSSATTNAALLVSSGGTIGPQLVRGLHGRVTKLTPGMVLAGLYARDMRRFGHYDLCVCDLSLDHLTRFREIFEKIRPLMSAKGKVVVFHQNTQLIQLSALAHQLVEHAFPLVGRSRIAFSGSRPGAFAMRCFAKLYATENLASWKGRLVAIPAILICAPLARIAVWLESRRRSNELPRKCTSIVLEING